MSAAVDSLSPELAYAATMLVDPSVLDRHPAPSSIFHDQRVGTMVAAARDLRDRGETVDTIAIRAWLIEHNALVRAGGDEMLLKVTGLAVAPSAGRYVEMIVNAYRARQVRAVVAQHSAALKSDDPDVVASLAASLDRILAAEVNTGPLMGSTWISELGEDPIGQIPTPQRWLLKRMVGGGVLPWLPLGKAGMLASAGGVGKTMLALQLALAVATGRTWLNAITVAEPGDVAVILAEEDREEVMRRLHSAANEMCLSAEERRRAAASIWINPRVGMRSALLESDPNGNLLESDFLRALRRHLRTAGRQWKLIILDPIARLAPPEAERDNQIATVLVGAVESLCQTPGGPTVLALHHTSKAMRDGRVLDAASARGVTAFNDGFRWSATLGNARNKKKKAIHNVIEIRVVKSNYSHPGWPLRLTRDGGSNGVLRPLSHEEEADHEFEEDAA